MCFSFPKEAIKVVIEMDAGMLTLSHCMLLRPTGRKEGRKKKGSPDQQVYAADGQSHLKSVPASSQELLCASSSTSSGKTFTLHTSPVSTDEA